MNTNNNLPLILGSSSPYRAKLLESLGLSFTQISPNIDESALLEEPPEPMVTRLAEQKALSLARNLTADAILITSDQIALHNNRVLGKPLSKHVQAQQLSEFSGHSVVFLTSLAVMNTFSGSIQQTIVPTTVKFRTLTAQQITLYCEKEDATQCAGGFKAEGLGISLFESIHSDDPNALIGLPLIQLCSFLKNEQQFPLS